MASLTPAAWDRTHIRVDLVIALLRIIWLAIFGRVNITHCMAEYLVVFEDNCFVKHN